MDIQIVTGTNIEYQIQQYLEEVGEEARAENILDLIYEHTGVYIE